MCLDEVGSKEKIWCGFMEVGRPALLENFAMWLWHLLFGSDE